MAVRTVSIMFAGSLAVRTSTKTVGAAVPRLRYNVGGAASRTLLYFVSRITPMISASAFCSNDDPIRWPIGFSAAEELLRGSFVDDRRCCRCGVVALIEVRVQGRIGISRVLKNVGDTDIT